MRKTSLLFVLVILMIASAGLFGWSFYQLGDKVSSETCSDYRPIEWPNGDYCGWKVWPNSVIRLASSAISLTVALITTYAVAKDIRFALILAIVIYIVSAATLLASTIIDAFSVTATKDSTYCLNSKLRFNEVLHYTRDFRNYVPYHGSLLSGVDLPRHRSESQA